MGETDAVISVGELRQHYEGEWVGGQVVERNADQTPSRLRVLVHSPDQSVVWQGLSGMSDACVIYAGDILPRGQEGFF